jgi:hypothetical protein
MKVRKLVLASVISLKSLLLISQIDLTDDEEKSLLAIGEIPEGWHFKGNVQMGVSGSYFSQWVAGGINSAGLNGILSYNANYMRGKNHWENNLTTGYGVMNQGFTTRDSWIKSDDRIEITSKYGRPLGKKAFMAALLNFNSQYSKGFENGSNGRPDRTKIISNFLAPARVLLALGYDSKPAEGISLFLSPATYRGIIVNDDLLAAQGAFGVTAGKIEYITNSSGELVPVIITPGQKIRQEAGAYFRIQLNRKIKDKLTVQLKSELFSNYMEKPQNIDIAADLNLQWQLSKYMSFSIGFSWLYDDNTTVTKIKSSEETINGETVTVSSAYASKGLQTRVISSIGLAYQF